MFAGIFQILITYFPYSGCQIPIRLVKNVRIRYPLNLNILIFFWLIFGIVGNRMFLKIFKHCLRSYNLQLDIERDNLNIWTTCCPIFYNTRKKKHILNLVYCYYYIVPWFNFFFQFKTLQGFRNILCVSGFKIIK